MQLASLLQTFFNIYLRRTGLRPLGLLAQARWPRPSTAILVVVGGTMLLFFVGWSAATVRRHRASAFDRRTASDPKTTINRASDRSDPIDSWTQGIAPRKWEYIVVHHSATRSGSVASIDEAHRQRTDSHGRHWLGIGYHFLIGNGQGMPDGQIEATFRWKRQLQGAHAGSERFNQRGIGICLVGDFDADRPTERQWKALGWLVRRLAARFDIEGANILAHRDIRPTECPGKHLTIAPLRSSVHATHWPRRATRVGNRFEIPCTTNRSNPRAPIR